jgi:hypothetical protein
MSFFDGSGDPSSINTDLQTLSTTEQADVTASSGSLSARASALSRSRLTVSKSMVTTAVASAPTTLEDMPGVPSRTRAPDPLELQPIVRQARVEVLDDGLQPVGIGKEISRVRRPLDDVLENGLIASAIGPFEGLDQRRHAGAASYAHRDIAAAHKGFELRGRPIDPDGRCRVVAPAARDDDGKRFNGLRGEVNVHSRRAIGSDDNPGELPLDPGGFKAS